MSKIEPTSGAFACSDHNDWQSGLTKREYFAAIAMQGWISTESNEYTFDDAKALVRTSVAYADALIEELNK